MLVGEARGLCTSAAVAAPLGSRQRGTRPRQCSSARGRGSRPACNSSSREPSSDAASAVGAPSSLGRRTLLAAGPASAAAAAFSLSWSPNARADIVDEYESQKVYYERRGSVVGLADIENITGTDKAAPVGSGFVWDRRGYIVTSATVVAKLAANPAAHETRVYITNPDGSQRQARARLLGLSQEYNIAVVTIDLPPGESFLQPVELGMPVPMRVGQRCYVIGRQGAQGHTFTYGVVSGLNRRLVAMNGGIVRRAIQTDADISAENSGGILMNSTGQVVGMTIVPQGRNIAKAPGVNFAMPIDTVMQVVPQLIAFGEVKNPVQEPVDTTTPRPAVSRI